MLLLSAALALAPLSLSLASATARADGGLWLDPKPNYGLVHPPPLAARALQCPASHPVLCPKWPNACTQVGKVCCDLTQGTSSCDEGEYCVMYRGEVKCCPNGENCNEEEYSYTTDTLTRTATEYTTETETASVVVTVTPKSSGSYYTTTYRAPAYTPPAYTPPTYTPATYTRNATTTASQYTPTADADEYDSSPTTTTTQIVVSGATPPDVASASSVPVNPSTSVQPPPPIPFANGAARRGVEVGILAAGLVLAGL
ncbi:uncharacterized protein LOC62_02G003453 [Vanrija pseudolonga]|uniref:Granulins domain-containing protein n=1 Tax=Vanrija pseudolonga TaxID=143232 RepID=A0AAF0Y891_9TREE|nr:hypothetical protein LOC62_02G003453 [Vanrija pseudolonga]